MDQKIHRFTVGYEGEMLEIVNPTELSLDENGGLNKAVWVNGKGVEERIEWNEKEKRYDSYENGALKIPKKPKRGRNSRR